MRQLMPMRMLISFVLAACASTACAGPRRNDSSKPPATETAATESFASRPTATPSGAVPAGSSGAADAAGAAPPIAYERCALPARLAARGWPTELSPVQPNEPEPFVPGTVTIAVLPDTQYYAACGSPHLGKQTQWIAEAAKPRDVRAVIQLGDLTDHNTDAEWKFVASAFAPLAEQVPLALATGNHDHGDDGTANKRSTAFGKYLGAFAGATARSVVETKDSGDRENAYLRLALPRVVIGILVLEWSPRKSTVEWANRVLTKYATDRVIIATHAYLYEDGTRYDWQAKGEAQEWNPLSYATSKRDPKLRAGGRNVLPDAAHDGEMLWNALVKRHRGVFLVLSGHVLGDGAAVLTSSGNAGNAVHQVLANYQMLREGGLGYLRLLELLPDGRTLRMKTYSPSLKLFATGKEQRGDLALDPALW